MLCADTRTSGEGNAVGMCSPRGLVISALPRMEIMCSAISFCWSTLQWFSRDRITGYSDVWGGTWEDSLTLVSKMFAMPRRARRTPTTSTHGRECYFRHSSHRMPSDEQSSTDSTTRDAGHHDNRCSGDNINIKYTEWKETTQGLSEYKWKQICTALDACTLM